ncbi:predicted protein [Plenodomus lingam JN3]|uniref:Predicted protein n=2 Tax=Leptosphaeria maculans TaxID=5022 RepID=E4ZII0_LEPMJ|nr:predicted protein [Plenodomus lingam JN3]CBX91001.1 predicted protein [Plenodomus lingam JN3]
MAFPQAAPGTGANPTQCACVRLFGPNLVVVVTPYREEAVPAGNQEVCAHRTRVQETILLSLRRQGLSLKRITLSYLSTSASTVRPRMKLLESGRGMAKRAGTNLHVRGDMPGVWPTSPLILSLATSHCSSKQSWQVSMDGANIQCALLLFKTTTPHPAPPALDIKTSHTAQPTALQSGKTSATCDTTSSSGLAYILPRWCQLHCSTEPQPVANPDRPPVPSPGQTLKRVVRLAGVAPAL